MNKIDWDDPALINSPLSIERCERVLNACEQYAFTMRGLSAEVLACLVWATAELKKAEGRG